MRDNNIVGITFRISDYRVLPYWTVICIFKEIENGCYLYKQFSICFEKMQKNKIFLNRESIEGGTKKDLSWGNVMTVVNVE
jgi:hypothetical protein